MPVPWEALVPFGRQYFSYVKVWIADVSCPGLLTTMFAAAGTLLNVSQRAQNQGKVSSIYSFVSALFFFPAFSSL